MDASVLASALAASCLEGFIDLCGSLKGFRTDHRFSTQISLVDSEDELGRFRVWAGNIGALQAGHSSLEYRLREASLVLQNVLKLLNELKALLQEITVVTSGTRLPYDEQIVPPSSDSDDDFDFGETEQDEAPKTELERNYLSIVDIIDNLYKLSIYIRNPTSRTRFSKAASFRVVDRESGVDLLGRYQEFDIEHVRHVFQDLRRTFSVDVRYQQNELIERLGKAITRRRQLFMYWKSHREKLSVNLASKKEAVKDYKIGSLQAANIGVEATLGAHLNGNSPAPNQAHSEKTKSAFTATTATLFVHRDDHADDLQSMISSATTARGLDGGRTLLPSPPKVPPGKDFECPYCFTICPAKYLNERNWRVHLLKDLQPYVCTYARCETGSQLYSSRHEWISHETHAHRKKWRCPAHPQVEYSSQRDYAKHLEQEHEQGTGSSNLPIMLDIGETTSNEISRVCPLCLIEEASSDRFYNHIAFHLESIAAFSLPRNTAGPEDDMQSVHTASTNANRGSQGSEFFETLSAFEEDPQRSSDVDEEPVSLNFDEFPDYFDRFSDCVRGYQAILTAGDFPLEYKHVQVRLKAEGHRFIKWWAEVTDFTHQTHFPNLISKDLAHEILHKKEELLRNFVEKMPSSEEPNTVEGLDLFELLPKTLRLAEGTGKYPNKVWVLVDQTKFVDLVRKLSLLNDDLMGLLQRGTLGASSQITEESRGIVFNFQLTRPESPPNAKLKDAGGSDKDQSWEVVEYGADPVYATGFDGGQIPRLPANTESSGSDDEAVPHRYPNRRVKFYASGDTVSEVEHVDVASDISSMPSDDELPIHPRETRPWMPPEDPSSPRIPLQPPRHLSLIETHFFDAVLHGDTPSAKGILENSILPRLGDYDLRDAINFAVENEDCSMVEMLLDVGEVYGKKRHSWKSLHTAARMGNINLVELLVQRGIAVDAKSDDDQSNPLHQAAKYGHRQVVDRLMSLAVVSQVDSGVNEVDINGMLPLHFAARHGHEASAGTLIMASSVDQQNSLGRTPLIEAARSGADQIVKLLLENGADVNSKDRDGKNALHEVVHNGHALIIDMLLAAGADVGSRTLLGWTPLHFVLNHKETTIARMLLENGAELDARNAKGETILNLVAGVPQQHRLVILFLREGADPNLVSHPLGLDAYERQSPLRTACSVLGNVETVRALIEGGADVNADTIRTGTALQAACQAGDLDIINLLIGNGAFVGAPRPLAPSPLQEAARNGHIEIVKLLLDKDADIDEQSDVLGTALEAACRGGHRSIADFLIRRGADLTARDAYGQRDRYSRTIVDLAIAQDDIGLAQFLVNAIQEALGFEHRETLAAEAKLKSAIESRDDIEGHSSEHQQRTSRDTHDFDPSAKSPEDNAVTRRRDRSSQSNPERLARAKTEEDTKGKKRDRSAQSNPEKSAPATPTEDWLSVKPCPGCNGTGTEIKSSEIFQTLCAKCEGKGFIRREGHPKVNDGSSSDSNSDSNRPRRGTLSAKERVNEDTNTLSSVVLQAREQLIQAMKKPQDRSLLLRHEKKILRFINSVESTGDSIDEGPRSPHSRALIETLATYYGLRSMLRRVDNNLILYRGHQTIRPARLWMLETLQSASSVAELQSPLEAGLESDDSSPRSPSHILVKAMKNENDRAFLLRIEGRIIEFVKQEKDGHMDLLWANVTDRTLIRRLAEYYGLLYSLLDDSDRVRLQRVSDARLRLPIPLSELESSLLDKQYPKEPERRRESIGRFDFPKELRPSVRGILKQPKPQFPETADTIREGVAPLKEPGDLRGIPAGARWTKIDRKLVSPAALEEARERFEERRDSVIVLRVLSKEEVQKFALRTQEIREGGDGSDFASEDEAAQPPKARVAQERDKIDVRPDIIANAKYMMGAVPDSEMKKDPEADAKVVAFQSRSSHQRTILSSDDDSDEPALEAPTTQITDSEASSDEGPTEDNSTSAQYGADENAPGLSDHLFGTVVTLQLRDKMKATNDNDMRGNAIALMDFEVSDPGYGHPNEIPLSRGQRIDIISRLDEEYLNIRDRQGQEGVVPQSFVVLTEFLGYARRAFLDGIFSRKDGHTGAPLMRAPLSKGDEDRDQLPSKSAPAFSSSSGLNTDEAFSDTEDGFYAEATSSFVPENESQMALIEGHLVWVESLVDDHWALARKPLADGTRIGSESGLVPRNLLFWKEPKGKMRPQTEVGTAEGLNADGTKMVPFSWTRSWNDTRQMQLVPAETIDTQLGSRRVPSPDQQDQRSRTDISLKQPRRSSR